MFALIERTGTHRLLKGAGHDVRRTFYRWKLRQPIPYWLMEQRRIAIYCILSAVRGLRNFPEYRNFGRRFTKKNLKRLSIWKLVEMRKDITSVWAERQQRGKSVYG
jgi:hypothetical protein